jgi:hypothetical protein
MEYRILTDKDAIALSRRVEEYLRVGWELAGGVAFNSRADLWAQAIVFRKPG